MIFPRTGKSNILFKMLPIMFIPFIFSVHSDCFLDFRSHLFSYYLPILQPHTPAMSCVDFPMASGSTHIDPRSLQSQRWRWNITMNCHHNADDGTSQWIVITHEHKKVTKRTPNSPHHGWCQRATTTKLITQRVAWSLTSSPPLHHLSIWQNPTQGAMNRREPARRQSNGKRRRRAVRKVRSISRWMHLYHDEVCVRHKMQMMWIRYTLQAQQTLLF